MDSASEGAGLLTGAWRLSPDLRLGGFIDYSLGRRDPQGLKSGDQRPMLGAFLAWDEGGNPDITSFSLISGALTLYLATSGADGRF
jgi:hypothetical protein